ncbi:suppressor of fused domain protein [Pseudoduganella violaceinigra]|uniref:suppressor of fused domain protein n=1 Tax=Pseudoduganella violaceinigra TaxID=246602 RepID=UPI000487ACB8|nr:suppressor of fused domain protein [Pseudoduganella violaceinigra]
MLEKSRVSLGLSAGLAKRPERVERFQLAPEWDVDIMEFEDRPYKGVRSIITNGVSERFPDVACEFVIIYDPSTITKDEDLNAFMATYLQLHFEKNRESIVVGDYFKVKGRLLRDYDFVGIYTSPPCYFADDVFSELRDINFYWLIPIYEAEYQFIEEAGVHAFEACLERLDPDLSRFDREVLELFCPDCVAPHAEVQKE